MPSCESELRKLLRDVQCRDPKAAAARFGRLDRAVGTIRRREQEKAAAWRRHLEGSASYEDYDLLLAEDVEANLVKCIPGLLLRSVWRAQGFAQMPVRAWGFSSDVLEILSFKPSEELPQDLRDVTEGWMKDTSDQNADDLERFSAALNLVALGADGGLQRRRQLWDGGLVDDLASQTFWESSAVSYSSPIDWTTWEETIALSVPPSRLPPPTWDASDGPAFTYADIAAAIADDRWREVWESGQTRSTAASDEDCETIMDSE